MFKVESNVVNRLDRAIDYRSQRNAQLVKPEGRSLGEE